MRIVATEYVTLDGIMGDPGGGEGSPYGGWSFAFWSDSAAKFKFDELFASDAILLGRLTYEGFSRAWPSMKDDAGFADRMNGLPKYVVSTTLHDPTWQNTTVISTDVAAEVAKLKAAPGQDLLLSGSAALVQFLAQHNLIDEYRLMVHPVILGGGKSLFGSLPHRISLKLTDSKTLDKGVVVLSYAPDQG